MFCKLQNLYTLKNKNESFNYFENVRSFFLYVSICSFLKVGEVVGAAGTEGSSRSTNKKMYNGKVTKISHQIMISLSYSRSILDSMPSPLA